MNARRSPARDDAVAADEEVVAGVDPAVVRPCGSPGRAGVPDRLGPATRRRVLDLGVVAGGVVEDDPLSTARTS
jgi:hypothetical protein